MKTIRKMIEDIRASVVDDAVRFRLQYLWVYRILGGIAAYMTVVNICTAEYLLMTATLVFSLACGLNILLLQHSNRGECISQVLFIIEIYTLFMFFIILGIPEGFSAIWICLIPSGGLLLFGRKKGTFVSVIMLLLLCFCFWTPWGRSILVYRYTDSFLLRFPMLYIAFYVVSFFLETIRVMTQTQLVKAQQKYQYLYLHDALTGIYNRYGFNEKMDERISDVGPDGLALMILDIDYFKDINDRYGHICGDVVLKQIADFLLQQIGAQGEVCRWGGEEFAILLHRAEGAERLANKICHDIGQQEILMGENIAKVTVSIGAAVVAPNQQVSAVSLVRNADNCMYCAKKRGRSLVVSCALSPE